MKICSLVLKKTQVYDPFGSVRLCCFANSTVGRLTENTMEEIWNGENAQNFFKRLAQQDYSLCNKNNCPYWASGRNEVPLIEIDAIPSFPQALSLSYEAVCNYNCTACADRKFAFFNVRNAEVDSRCKTIEKNLAPVLPHLKFISAHGTGELFCSKHILKVLADWRPIAPVEELSVGLETNGSLFDEKHWKQIENLGKYNLRVAITVMSFDEHTYQTLSGCRLPISKLENNLRFVKSLREKEIINHIQLATVVQERNFRMLPEFVRKCIEEFGADSVRLRPYIPYDSSPLEMKFISDTKNVFHPYHDEYLQILKDPIFQHPKVDNWGLVDENYKYDIQYKTILNNITQVRQTEEKILRELIINESVLDNLINFCRNSGKRIILHDIGSIGLMIAKKLIRANCNLVCITDMQLKGNLFGIPILPLNELPTSTDNNDKLVIFTSVNVDNNILNYFISKGYNNNFVGLPAIFGNKKLL